MVDICIIGGGAAGLSAAVSAKEINPKAKVLILEKKPQIGKKILASGNGKCNLSNINCKSFSETKEFFCNLGLKTKTDLEGRVYPYNEEAKAVVMALSERLRQRGALIRTEAVVTKVLKNSQEEGFLIHFNEDSKNKVVAARKVLIASGGKAAPKLGTSGDGYRWAKDLGHKVTKVVPALTAVDVFENVDSLKGVREKGEVSLYYKNKKIFAEKGEIQFTQKGISGICVFNLSRFLVVPEGKTLENGFSDYKIKVNFICDEDNVHDLLKERINLGLEKEKILLSLVKERLGRYILLESKGELSLMEEMLTSFTLRPKILKGWDFAQVTSGGVFLEEIDEKTMESKICKGLFFAGEITDYDGPCGGYNLENAWTSGRKAGKEMARCIESTK